VALETARPGPSLPWRALNSVHSRLASRPTAFGPRGLRGAAAASVSGRSGPAELRRAPPVLARDHGLRNACSIPSNAATEHCLRPGRSLPDADASSTLTEAWRPLASTDRGSSPRVNPAAI
jgi:hypothetical protein